MKHFCEKAHESIRSILEICFLVCVFFLPHIINATELIEMCFTNTTLNFDNVKFYLLLQLGNWVIGLLLFLYMLHIFRKTNKEKLLNNRNVYHDYSYFWYWFSSKILGYKKCNMKLVPIFMQYKLVLNDTFEDFYVGLDDDYSIKENEQINIKKIKYDPILNEVNLVFADTYPIIENQLPIIKKELSTIIISRNNNDFNRYYSPNFITNIINEVRNLSTTVNAINIYSTTNPKHTVKIAQDVFKLAERGNIKKLVVYQQSKDGIRKFGDKGKTIF